MPTVMHDVIKPAMVYLPTKLATQKFVVALLSPGNALNMALVLSKFSPHLLQFMNFQVVLLQVNLDPFVRILFVLFMTT